MDVIWIGTALAAGLAGALLGAAGAWYVINQRAEARHARLVAAARDQVTASTQNSRTTITRLQADLDKERSMAPQRVAASTAEQRASVARLEGQLRFAYAEIDRLNAAVKGKSRGSAGAAPPDSTMDPTGFALTRPYEG